MPSRRAFTKPDPTLTDELRTARLRFRKFEETIDVTYPSDEMLEEMGRFLTSLDG